MDNNYTIKTKSAPNWIYDWTKSIISVIFVVLIVLTFFFRIVNVVYLQKVFGLLQ